MSAMVCGKRSFFEDIDAAAASPANSSPPPYKKFRCSSSTSPVRFTYSPPVQTSSVDQLKALFPGLEIQLLEKAIEESVEDLDLATKKLHEFCRGHVKDKVDIAEESSTMENDAGAAGMPWIPMPRQHQEPASNCLFFELSS